jgi:hypothetical protein
MMRITSLTKVVATGLYAAAAVFANVANASPVSVETNMPGLLGDYRVHDWFTYYTSAMNTSPLNLGVDLSRLNRVEFVISGVVEFPIFRNAETGLYTGDVNAMIGFGRPNPSDTVIQWGMPLAASGDYDGSHLGMGDGWSYQIDAQNNFVLDLFSSWLGDYAPAVQNGIGGGTLAFAPHEADGFQTDTLIQDGSVHVTGAVLRINGESSANAASVPEPSAALLLAGGLLTIGAVRRSSKFTGR